MLRSLVGSEMCIRDSPVPCLSAWPLRPARLSACQASVSSCKYQQPGRLSHAWLHFNFGCHFISTRYRVGGAAPPQTSRLHTHACLHLGVISLLNGIGLGGCAPQAPRLYTHAYLHLDVISFQNRMWLEGQRTPRPPYTHACLHLDVISF